MLAKLDWGDYVRYSPDETAAIVQAGTTYQFYPMDGGPPREIRVRREDHNGYTVFQSHKVSYRWREVKGEFAQIARVEYLFGDNGNELDAVEVWSRTYPYAEFGETTQSAVVSDDGDWVVLGLDRRGVVIDASTGKTTVSVPFDETARKTRGNPTGVHFRDGRLLLYRHRIGQAAGFRVSERFVEVFDPNTVNLQGQPNSRMRVETVPQKRFAGFVGADAPEGFFELFPHGGKTETPCSRSVLSDGRTLVADNNRLTYQVPQQRDGR